MKLSRTALLLAFLLGCESTPAPTMPPSPPPPAAAPAPPPAAPTSAPTSAAPAAPKFPAGWPHPMDAPGATGEHGMVVTDATLATKVGVEVLKSGGNAVDAAVATAFALAVVYPGAGNIGGGGFMVARVGGQAHALDFRETAPAAAKPDLYAKKPDAMPGAATGVPGMPTAAPAKPDAKKPDAKPEKGGDSRIGHLASGVPGSVAGLWEAHQKLGSKKKTWAELIAPAIKLAEEGFTVDKELARAVGEAKRMTAYPASAKLFFPGGEPLKEGTVWKNPDLAAALKRIAEKGPEGFYKGRTAELLVAEMKRGGGLITAADLNAYKAKWRTPVELDYRGHHIISMPPPSSGGVTLGMICHILEGYELSALPYHGPAELHLVFEAARRAFLARNAKLGDPDFVKNPVEELLSPQWAQAQRATIKPDRATPTEELQPAPPSGGAGPHTTNFSVVDEQGNAVALTTTVNWWFGSGVTVAGAGFVMNNEMDDFATVPGQANSYGLVQGEPNAVAPGKRMLSSMTPSIVTGKDGHVNLVLGAAGGPTIISAVFDILSGVVDHKLGVVASTNAPRFHEQGQPDVVMIEKGGLPEADRKALEAMGYIFKEREHIADAPSIGWSGGKWIGAAEPRRMGGFALGY